MTLLGSSRSAFSYRRLASNRSSRPRRERCQLARMAQSHVSKLSGDFRSVRRASAEMKAGATVVVIASLISS